MPRGWVGFGWLALLGTLLVGAAVIFSPPGGDSEQVGLGFGSKVPAPSLTMHPVYLCPVLFLSLVISSSSWTGASYELTLYARKKVVLDSDGEPQSVRDLAAEAKKVLPQASYPFPKSPGCLPNKTPSTTIPGAPFPSRMRHRRRYWLSHVIRWLDSRCSKGSTRHRG